MINAVLYSDQIIPANAKVDVRLRQMMKHRGNRIGYIPSGPDPSLRFFSKRRSYYAQHNLELAFLFRLVNTSVSAEDALRTGPPADSEVLYKNRNGQRIPILVYKQAIVGASDLTDAQASSNRLTNEPVVNFKFNVSGTRKLGAATQKNVGRSFAIVLDNEVISAPVIREPILGGSGQISGNFTAESANNLALLLRAGALPAKFDVIDASPITVPK